MFGVSLHWNQPRWIFHGSRRGVRRVFKKYWFFSRIRWHNGGLPCTRLDDSSNTVGRCITVWNLNAVDVVTGPTSRYSCITSSRYGAVSDILSGRLLSCIYMCVYVCVCVCCVLHTHTHTSPLNSKFGGLARYGCNANDPELSRPLIRGSRSMQPQSENYL